MECDVETFTPSVFQKSSSSQITKTPLNALVSQANGGHTTKAGLSDSEKKLMDCYLASGCSEDIKRL